MGLDKCGMTYSYHYSIIGSIFTALNPLCPTYSSVPYLSHGNHCFVLFFFFYYLHRVAFSRMSYSWNDTIVDFWLHSLGNMHLNFLHVFSWLGSSFLFALDNISLSGYTGLFIHLSTEGHLGCFQVLAIISKAAINIHM